MCERLFLKMVFLKGKTESTFRASSNIHTVAVHPIPLGSAYYSNSKKEDKQTKMI